MPKIIHNLEEKILEAAWELFVREGYDRVSIRMLAKTLNIASGTIYNYFSRKEDIYFKIFSLSWQKTKDRINEITVSTIPQNEKEEKLVRSVYRDSRERREALYAGFTSEWKIKRFGESWSQAVKESPSEILAGLFSGSPKAERHGVVFLHGIRGCLAQFPGEDEQNISYLIDLYRLIKREYS